MPCSLLHGHGEAAEAGPRAPTIGFEELFRPEEEHICCGSAGTYSMLQGVMSEALKRRKLDAIKDLEVDVVASANIGCMTQLDGGLAVPTVMWLSYWTGLLQGPVPNELDGSMPGGVNGKTHHLA